MLRHKVKDIKLTYTECMNILISKLYNTVLK